MLLDMGVTDGPAKRAVVADAGYLGDPGVPTYCFNGKTSKLPQGTPTIIRKISRMKSRRLFLETVMVLCLSDHCSCVTDGTARWVWKSIAVMEGFMIRS